MSFFGFISDFVVFVFGFWYATLDLYMALAKRNGNRPNTRFMLGHFVVIVAFLTITLPADALIGSSFLYSLAKVIFVFYLLHRNYRGSLHMFDVCVEGLLQLFPQVVEFADHAHESEIAQDVKAIGTGVFSRLRAEYQEIFDNIDVDNE
jgi:hypothetical protein